jgi:hypothetical protein
MDVLPTFDYYVVAKSTMDIHVHRALPAVLATFDGSLPFLAELH